MNLSSQFNQIFLTKNISFGARTRIAHRPGGMGVGGSNCTITVCVNNQLQGIVISRIGCAREKPDKMI